MATGIDKERFRIEVRDAGSGALAVVLPHLTERFYHDRNVAAGGSGLGLPIVKRVAELNDARLSLSNILGGGLEAELEWVLPQKLNA